MKQFLATTAACFCALLLFGLVAYATLTIISGLEDEPSDSGIGPTDIVNPPGFKFIEDRQVANADTFTVFGVVKNTSQITWKAAYIKLRLKSYGKLLRSCDGMLFALKPSSKRAFLIECMDTEQPDSARQYEHELVIDHATQEGN
jgi:hypothetical protein